MGTTDGDGTDGGGALGTDGQQKEPNNPKGFGGRNRDAATTPQGGTGVPETWGGTRVT